MKTVLQNVTKGEEHSYDCQGCRDEKYVLTIRFESRAERDLVYRFMATQDLAVINSFSMNKSTEEGSHETNDEGNR